MLCLLRGCSRFSSSFLRFLPSQTLKKVMIGTSQFTTFIFLDLETTGLRKPVEITELCMVAVERSHIIERVSGRFAYGSFRLRSVRLRIESIRLRLICQFAYESDVEALKLNY